MLADVGLVAGLPVARFVRGWLASLGSSSFDLAVVVEFWGSRLQVAAAKSLEVRARVLRKSGARPTSTVLNAMFRVRI